MRIYFMFAKQKHSKNGEKASLLEVSLQKNLCWQNCSALSTDYIVPHVFIHDPLFGHEHELYLLTMGSSPALPLKICVKNDASKHPDYGSSPAPHWRTPKHHISAASQIYCCDFLGTRSVKEISYPLSTCTSSVLQMPRSTRRALSDGSLQIL